MDPGAGCGVRVGDRVQHLLAAGGQVVDHPRHRRITRHRTNDGRRVAQHCDLSQAVAAGGQGVAELGHNPGRVVHRAGPSP
jgi:hypothetical protein